MGPGITTKYAKIIACVLAVVIIGIIIAIAR